MDCENSLHHPEHRTELNGCDCSQRPVVTRTASLCSADLDHTAGPCDTVQIIYGYFLKKEFHTCPHLSKVTEDRWEETEHAAHDL